MLLFAEEGGADGVDGVEFFPREELYFAGERFLVARFEGLDNSAGSASDVSVRSCFGIYWVAEFEALLDGVGAHVELFHSLNFGCYPGVA